MTRKAQPVTLSSNKTRSLKNIITRGRTSARALSRARILDLLHRRQQPADIATVLQVTPQTVYNVNLNTHSISAFYEMFNAEVAFTLSQRFEFYYTPKKASWLNMIEIEFLALSKQCLSRRIASKQELEQEVSVIVKEREKKAIKIEWQFSIESARSKLNRYYQQVNAENAPD